MDKQNRLAIGRPAVPVGAVGMSQQLRLSAAERYQEDMRTLEPLHVASNRKLLAVRREAMAAIASRRGAHVDGDRLSACGRNLHYPSGLVKDQALPVAGPIGGFKIASGFIDRDGESLIFDQAGRIMEIPAAGGQP